MKQLAALLDRANPKAFGMLAIVTRNEDGTLSTEGLAEPADHALDRETFAALVEARDAVEIKGGIPVPDEHYPCAALWLGDEFATAADALGLLLPPPDALLKRTNITGGSFWLVRISHAYRILDVWLQHAGRRAFAEDDGRIARLMSWTLPDRDETRAAVWATSSDKSSEMAWQIKIERDRRRSTDAVSLQSRFEQVRDRVTAVASLRVMGFTGLAKCGDSEIAKSISRQRGIPHVSFGKWLRGQAEAKHQAPKRHTLQLLGQHEVVASGALPFCLSVMEATLASESPHGVGHRIASQPYVLESVRHEPVLEAAKFLAGPDRFFLAEAQRPEPTRRELLLAEQADMDVDEVMDDITEQGVPLVAKHAEMRVQTDNGVEAAANEVLAAAGF